MLKNLKSQLNISLIYFNQFQSKQNNKRLTYNHLQYYTMYQERYNLSKLIIFGTK